MQALTICSVSFRNRSHLLLNQAVSQTLNPSTRLQWKIAENTPSAEAQQRLNPTAEMTILEGYQVAPHEVMPPNYHHALGLNEVLRHLDSRYVLILDPDFYIVRPDWARDMRLIKSCSVWGWQG